MPHVTAGDGVKLYYEEAGRGTPILFVHEFMGECRSWEAQLRYFSRRYRCIAYNARGYPPSDVPQQAEDYGFEHQRAGILAMLDGLNIDRAHIVGLSMGAFATFYFGMQWPERALSLTLAGIGSGSMPESRARFRQESEAAADQLLAEGWEKSAAVRVQSPTRVQLQNKNPRAYAEFLDLVERHSAKGSALTLKGYQALRPSLGDFTEQMAKCTVPALIISGDEDEPCLDASLMLKRHMPSAGLVFMPQTGHACNLEEPELFNMVCEKFFHQVESGEYRMRDPRATPGRIL
ncbi:MAG: alpha/beta hydrolase [Betaproteobacteria bacterium RIFCSPLOWO2_12_FULL_64_23]|nr:MAG: alpha/beta hydrolase [Betaproteobacteria bacterium RIFCSPLOWO2_12_FULL_64_23]